MTLNLLLIINDFNSFMKEFMKISGLQINALQTNKLVSMIGTSVTKELIAF